ncbi:hypothetical protein HID58_045743, partial [Brassica napus]
AEVKAGKPLKVKPDEDCLIHLSQVCIDNGKKGETAFLYVTVDGKKLVIGTLSQGNIPQISLDLIFDQEFELSHSLETGSVHFIGYKSPNIDDEECYSSSDSSSSEEVEVPATDTANGNAGAAASSVVKADSEPKAKPAEEVKHESEDDDDEGSDSGAKVKAGQSLKVKPGENCLIHISQASLGKAENGVSALLYATVDDKKLLLGTLSQDVSFDHLLFDREFELSHTLDRGSVNFIGHQRNKKKRANESSKTPVSFKKSKPNTENSFEEITKICQNLVLLLKSFPTKKDIPAIFDKWERTANSRWPLKRDSWRDKRRDNIPPQYIQTQGNCWAIAFYRQWSTMAKLKGRSRPKLTLDKLMSGVSFRYRTVDGQLRKLEAAVEFMKNEHYVDEMFLHVKPSGDSEDEKFERLIERLLLEGPVAVSFEYFPSYRTGIERILSPTLTERLRNPYEHTSKHVGLLMGSGIESTVKTLTYGP